MLPDGRRLSEADLEILRALRLKVQDNLSGRTFERLSQVFRSSTLPSLAVCERRLHVLAGMEPQFYDMCINSCISYAPEQYRHRTTCPYCAEPRHDRAGRPRRRFQYHPFTPRLIARQENPVQAELMQYRARHTHIPGRMTDYVDARLYRTLLDQTVEVNGKKLDHQYFSDHRDIALALSTDGFAPFKKRQSTSWPIILFIFNLPPDLRYHLEHILCVAEIPGPKKPKDWCSFLWPVLMELIKLAEGVRGFDGLSQTLYALHAYLIMVFGDMPAVAMMMRMLGHNAISPCRACHITGVRIPDKPKSTTHYVPLDRSTHPSSPLPSRYDPRRLPLRDHHSFMQQARAVESAPTAAARDRLRKRTGIKGVAALSTLSSLSFPESFPHDFMHLIFENVIPALTLLWTGKFKDFPPDDKFVLPLTIWDAISEAGRQSKDTIPSSFGAAVPNISSQRSQMTAETWSFWATYIAPVVLRRRFRHEVYYRHFVSLVKLIKLCLQYEYTEDDISKIEEGFIDWVQQFEK